MFEACATVAGTLDYSACVVRETYKFLRSIHPDLALLATICALVTAAWGAYRAWMNWGRTIRRLFTKFLQSEEKYVAEQKTTVSLELQQRPDSQGIVEAIDFHKEIKRALSLSKNGKLAKAEGVLGSLRTKLIEREELAQRQVDVARRQISAVHLFLGSTAAARQKPRDAIAEFRKVLDPKMSPRDTDALKYVSEQYLALCVVEPNSRDTHAQDALDAAKQMHEFASDEKNPEKRDYIEAEALLLQGRAQLNLGKKGLARERLAAGIDKANWENKHHVLVAQLQEFHGDACDSSARKIADTSYRISSERYSKANDQERARAVEEKRKRLNSTVQVVQVEPDKIQANGKGQERLKQ